MGFQLPSSSFDWAKVENIFALNKCGCTNLMISSQKDIQRIK